MKKRKYSISLKIALITLAIFSIFLFACPPLDEEPFNNTLTYSGQLDLNRWIKILSDIEKQGIPIKLDLSACTVNTGNAAGGLVSLALTDGSYERPGESGTPRNYIVFDPVSSVPIGKKYIQEIILPDVATMIINAVPSFSYPVAKSIENEGIEKSAFRHFTNLKSVTGRRITLIGHFAFYGLTNLEKVNMPAVGHIVRSDELSDYPNNLMMSRGHRTDIGHYAFYGCTSLKEANFPTAAVIGIRSFMGCTSLNKLSFPRIWMISSGAFEGCTSLKDIIFPSATKIGDDSFKNCTSLKTATFTANPTRNTSTHPLQPWLDLNVANPVWPPISSTVANGGAPIPVDGIPCTYDSVIFFPYAFSGCKALEKLDVGNAWHVYFANGVLENIGKTLDLYLFNDNFTKSFGHPQIETYLGIPDNGADIPTTYSLETITLWVPKVDMSDTEPPVDAVHFDFACWGYPGIISDINSRYQGKIKIEIEWME